MNKTIFKPSKYLVYHNPTTVPDGTPHWAWSLEYANDDKDKAIRKYIELKYQYPKDEVVISIQQTVDLLEVAN